jgi:hypothetical protein
MSMMPRPASLDWVAGAVLVLTLVILSGCQSPSSPGPQQTVEPWRVLERVGDVRSARNADILTEAIRPGDNIVDGGIVSTGKGSLAILKAGGVQLTLGESTSIRLSARGVTDISLNHGRLRVRAATPVNRKARIVTQDFELQSSSAAYVLLADHDGATLSVDSGSVVLSSTDGRHRAVLAAGAGAMIDRTSSNDLMIRHASNEAFKRVSPLSAEGPNSETSSPAMPPAGTTDRLESVIIRPASRPAPKRESEQALATEIDLGGEVAAQVATESAKPDIIPVVSPWTPIPLSVEPRDAWPSDDADNDALSPEQTPDPAEKLDVLQMQFDLLTEGLADNL